MEVEQFMLSWICLHKFADAKFWNNSKTALYYTIKLGQIIYNKGIFLNLICNLKSDWSLVPGPFCFY